MTEERDRLPMVGWYDPFQLAQTGVDVLVSTIFGRHADYRLVEALAAPVTEPPDYSHYWTDCEDGTPRPDPSRPRDEIWIDYVADSGDGWNSTYAVAYYLSRERLAVSDAAGASHATPRGDLLVLGGDQVYPVASRAAYRQRLLAPYQTALGSTAAPNPHVYAVPGNHDWYDSLVCFSRLFSAGRWFGGWRALQRRSYFALKLPHGWWLLGTDVQLGSDIDVPQVEFFKEVAKHVGPKDRIILCNAEPHWIYSKVYRRYDELVYNEANLAFLERRALGRRDAVRVFLAGDLHHYRRHEAADGTQKITAGGGGAFLHPTHGPNVDTIDERDEQGGDCRRFERRVSWPDEKTSRRLCWRNLAFPYLNPLFGTVPAVLYAVVAWTLMSNIGGDGTLDAALRTTLARALVGPGPASLVMVTVLVFILFTDTHNRLYRGVAGGLHALLHLTAVFFIGWGATRLVALMFGPEHQLVRGVGAGLLIGAGGWLVGSLIMGFYLLVSLNVFRRHSNEAFSGLRIEGWKHFLRLHIDAAGGLTIYPIGIRTIPRRWRAGTKGGPGIEPDDPRATPPALIEAPIRVT